MSQSKDIVAVYQGDDRRNLELITQALYQKEVNFYVSPPIDLLEDDWRLPFGFKIIVHAAKELVARQIISELELH